MRNYWSGDVDHNFGNNNGRKFIKKSGIGHIGQGVHVSGEMSPNMWWNSHPRWKESSHEGISRVVTPWAKNKKSLTCMIEYMTPMTTFMPIYDKSDSKFSQGGLMREEWAHKVV